jgi:prophage regulatory protein
MAFRLVGAAEIRGMLGGVSKQRVYQITTKKGYPDPVAVLQVGKVWLAEDVEKWIEENRPDLAGEWRQRERPPGWMPGAIVRSKGCPRRTIQTCRFSDATAPHASVGFARDRHRPSHRL